MPRTSTTWKKGVSGNPRGRTKGSRDRRTLYREGLAKHVPELVRLLLAAARAGEVSAARALLEQALPRTKPRAEVVPVDLGEGRLTERVEQVLRHLAEGALNVEEAVSLIGSLATMTRIVEAEALEQRIAALERQVSA